MSKISKQQKAYREANKEKISQQRSAYYQANKENFIKKRKERYWANPDEARKLTLEYYAANKERMSEQNKVWSQNNNDKMKQYKRAYCARNPEKLKKKRLCKKYNLKPEEYDVLMEKAGNICPICEVDFDWVNRHKANRPCIDHCHKTGKVRGVICGQCNAAIGQLNDDTKRLERAMWWLTR